MNASPEPTTRRTSDSSARGRSVLLTVILGLILLSMGWQAAHRYSCCPDDTARNLPLPHQTLQHPPLSSAHAEPSVPNESAK